MTLEEFEPKIREVISNTTVSDEDDIPFASYEDFLGEVKAGTVQVGCRYDGDLVAMLGTKSERLLHFILLSSPFVIAVACIAIAIMSPNYWLLLGVLLAAAGFFFSSPAFMRVFGGRLVLVLALVLLAYALFASHSTTAILAGSYALSNLLTIAAREQCATIVRRSALLSEPVFIYLLGNKRIHLFCE